MFSWSRRTQILGLVGALIIAAAVVVIVASSSTQGGGSSYYIALGDSLAVGIQPNAQGQQLKTDQGYVDDLYAHLKTRLPGLVLKELGCPGDDTANVASGQGNTAAVAVYHCDRQGGSQLTAALNFIRAHRSQVKVVTIDIGANDVLNCLSPTVYDQGMAQVLACIGQGQQSIAANMPKILAPLKAAAAPGTALIGGQIYDPFLSGLLSNNPMLDTIASQSVGLITKINGEIAYADLKAGFRTANVAGAFGTSDATKVSDPALGGSVPRSLALLCRYTWVCATAPRGPNIHPTAAGYRAMAAAYEAVLPSGL